MTIAVGCTGGKHRSVAMAEALGRPARGARVLPMHRIGAVVHRDLGARVTADARPAVVALGGGHGLAASLRALRRVTDDLHRGRHGRRRRRVQRPACARSSACCRRATCGWPWPPCAATTSGAGPGATCSSTASRATGDLHDHAVGNLLIVALWELLGDTVDGLDWVGAPARAPAVACSRWRRSRWRSRRVVAGLHPDGDLSERSRP